MREGLSEKTDKEGPKESNGRCASPPQRPLGAEHSKEAQQIQGPEVTRPADPGRPIRLAYSKKRNGSELIGRPPRELMKKISSF